MQLTEKQLSSYRNLYKRQFGVEISREKALEQGIQLLNLVKLVYKQPITKKDLELLNGDNYEKQE